MKKIKVGIMGGAGYTGGELVRILLHHEAVTLHSVQSRSQAGKPLSSVHRDLFGETDLLFQASLAENLGELDALFLALPHGESRQFLESNAIPDSLKIIDFSSDFRLREQSRLGPREFVYGLPELNRERIAGATSIANPGCFATAIELSLLPLAHSGAVKRASVTGITGSTGAGVKPGASTHFSFRANNIQAYKTLAHQHVAEVEETLASARTNSEVKVAFIPWRGDFTRGIFVSSLVETALLLPQVKKLYADFYRDHPFVHLSDHAIDLKSVVNTNRVLIELVQEGSQLVIHVALDNLLKGASGQAVQNFNLLYRLPEMQGLKLKGVAF